MSKFSKLVALTVVLAMTLAVAATAMAQDNGAEQRTTASASPSNDLIVAERAGFAGVKVIGRGSDTTYSVSSDLGNLYTFSPTRDDSVTSENTEADTVLNAPPQGSSVGIAQLADFANLQDDPAKDEPTAFARSSRGPRDTDPSGLRFTSFARDAIVPVTFGAQSGPAQGVDNLTRGQLRSIFVTCKITNFKQIGGDNAQIEVYGIQEGSGTKATFDQFLGGDTNSCITDPNNIIFENNANPILQADEGVDPAERGRAIFGFSFARLSTSVPNENINALAVNGVEASAETIADQSFPFVRDVYFVTVLNNQKGNLYANEAADRFVNWVCKPKSKHTKDPITGNNYGKEIDNTIAANGFGLKSCQSTTTNN